MKLGRVPKLDIRNTATAKKKKKKKNDDNVMSKNCDVTGIFLIYGQLGAIQKLGS